MSLPREQQPQSPAAATAMDDAEQQMRRALGLSGDGPRPRPESERSEPASRTTGGFMQGAHRRRFVQDGEVPVTVVRRDTQDTSHPPGGQLPPTSSRLQRVEAALAAETAGRERAERALHDAQATVQALQTKMGHNELAKQEAIASSKRQLDEMVALKEQMVSGAERLHEAEARVNEMEEDLHAVRTELAEERRARKLAERLLREATEEAAATAATEIAPVHRPRDTIERMPARRGRPAAVHVEPDAEPEPVKWWLLPAKTAGKRR